jgi:hypothetical protein
MKINYSNKNTTKILLIILIFAISINGVLADNWRIAGGSPSYSNYSGTQGFANFNYLYAMNDSNLPGAVTASCGQTATLYSNNTATCTSPAIANRTDFGPFTDGSYLWWHPMTNNGAMIKFTAPSTAMYQYNVTFYKYTGGSSVQFYVKKNGHAGTQLNATNLTGGSTINYRGTISLSTGENLVFYNYDTDGTSGDSSGIMLNITSVTSYAAPANISNATCTSCNLPTGDNTPPYTTDDTTPTFTFNTDIQAACRIDNDDLNYTTMGSTRNCTTGDGTTSHLCTLNPSDELTTANSYIYIACNNFFTGNESNKSTASLLMDITSLSTNASRAIQEGIEASIIWPGATVYSDQLVYLRAMNNSQLLARADKIATYGNQRWIINYAMDNESTLGLFNITPVIYVLDMKNKSFTNIRGNVTAYINSTKN